MKRCLLSNQFIGPIFIPFLEPNNLQIHPGPNQQTEVRLVGRGVEQNDAIWLDKRIWFKLG